MNRAAQRAATRRKKRHPEGVSPEEALRAGIGRHRAGDLREAEVVYHKVLGVTPENVDALHFLGILRHQQGRTDEGVGLVQRALSLAPTYVDAWSNLGNLFKESARMEQAEAAYRRALELDERHAAAWNNLGVVLRARGQGAEAVETLRRAVDISPNFADAQFNLANALRECRRLPEAIAAYRDVLKLNPGHALAHYRLGYALYMTGAHEEAAEIFRHWHSVEPENPVPAHMLAACSGDNVPRRASDDYVRKTFDGFAASFDDVLLHRLDYEAPQQLLKVLAASLEDSGRLYDILDAGCGTGLCEPLLKPYARSLTGVDLSPGMLVKARARKSYDHLHEAEITHFLAARAAAFDVIASADTLCYFGDLQPFARAAWVALRAGGWIAFTVERGGDVGTYRLQPHGRYCHSRAYVDETLRHAGFEAIHIVAAVLRRELGLDVEGWVVRARVPETADDH
ncbi:MAG TPA: tetratricopeptide repeat protein [Casimicrobiaceae bacterium]|nr:tetratricopeptide repeat protein [Casimicrobiaceae bacterium]